jgi:hypothetical protein
VIVMREGKRWGEEGGEGYEVLREDASQSSRSPYLVPDEIWVSYNKSSWIMCFQPLGQPRSKQGNLKHRTRRRNI